MAKTKTPPRFVPASREEVTQAIRSIGGHQRERARIEAAMNDHLALIRERFEAEAAPHAERIKLLSEGVEIWCDANREALTDGGRTKTVNLASGEVKWRTSPPKVVIKKADQVLEVLRQRGLTDYIRVKEEISKEAILASPDAVAGIRGISIEQDEQFVIEPFETKLEDAA
jgi:phage host-nuclease inhibitor protein Gam